MKSRKTKHSFFEKDQSVVLNVCGKEIAGLKFRRDKEPIHSIIFNALV